MQATVEAVRELIAEKYTAQTRLIIDRVSDGVRSGGFVWHREADDRPGQVGLRGTLYAELDDAGLIRYVREGCEPLLKPGEATEQLLKAATKDMERPPKPEPTFVQATPTSAHIPSHARQIASSPSNGGAPSVAEPKYAALKSRKTIALASHIEAPIPETTERICG